MPTDSSRTTVLVVDNRAVTRKSCEQILSREGFRVTAAADGRTALDLIAALPHAVILLDRYLPACDGLALMPRIRELAPTTPIVLITGYPTIGVAVEAMKYGAADCQAKPFTADQLRRVVTDVLRPLSPDDR